MQSYRVDIRNAVRALIKSFYSSAVVCAQYYAPADSEDEYALVYFSDGNARDDGVIYRMHAELRIVFFKRGAVSDDDLDFRENELMQAIESDDSLQHLMVGFDFSGFSYVETDDERLSGLSLRFAIVY